MSASNLTKRLLQFGAVAALLAACLPDEYPSWYASLPPGADVARRERDEWGWSQADAAREALTGWRLPERLWRALAVSLRRSPIRA